MQKETPETDKIRPRTKSPSHKMRARQKETDQHVSHYLFIYLFIYHITSFPLFKAYMLGFSQVHKVSSRADHNTRNYIPYSYCNKCVGSLTFPTN